MLFLGNVVSVIIFPKRKINFLIEKKKVFQKKIMKNEYFICLIEYLKALNEYFKKISKSFLIVKILTINTQPKKSDPFESLFNYKLFAN